MPVAPVNALKRVWNYRTAEDKRDPLGCGESSPTASPIKLDYAVPPDKTIPNVVLRELSSATTDNKVRATW